MKIAFIGFGEAARAFQKSLAAKELTLRFAAYDILLDGEGVDGPCGNAMRSHGVDITPSPREAVAAADWVFSAVTADQSLDAAKSIASHLKPGHILFDINSVSPQRKRDSAAVIRQTGATYVDMAVMAPVHPRGHATPALLAGSCDDALVQRLANLGFAFEIVGPDIGAATAIKMVRSLFVKGLEAITVETLLAASASGCLDYILKSLASSYPGLGFPDFAAYQFERTTKHGKRRAAEMHESAATLNDLGLHGKLAEAIADVQERMSGLPVEGSWTEDPEHVIERLLASRGMSCDRRA
jgi:3-hydroxyisobutyrate dehydrogenase-like beta-hydroxyacid dehydrogenase